MTALEAEKAVNQVKEMRKEAEDALSKLESFHEIVTRMIQDISETMNTGISRSEEYLAELNELARSGEAEKNPVLRTLIEYMQDDLSWFKHEGARLADIRRRYEAMSRLYLKPVPAQT